MTIEASMYSLLAALGATSPDTVPENTDPPYIVYSANRTPGNYVDNSTPLEHVRFTIDVHHTTRLGARTLANSIKTALQAASFGGFVTGDQDIYEPEVKLYRVVLEHEVYAQQG